MLILLPPSEGKAAATRRGRPVELDRLSHPELTDVRLAVRDALIKISGHTDAYRVLGVSPSQAEELERNTRLDTLPGLPVSRVYTGVLYDALDYAGLSTGGRRRATRAVRVQSALWGPVGLNDRIAPYRLSMGVTLPDVGPLARLWRSRLGPVLGGLAGSGVVVDCRSSTYTAAWQPSPDLIGRYVAIRPLHRGRRPPGRDLAPGQAHPWPGRAAAARGRHPAADAGGGGETGRRRISLRTGRSWSPRLQPRRDSMIILRRLDEGDRRAFEATGMLAGPADGLRWHPEYPTENTMIGYRLSLDAQQPDPDTTPWWMYHVVRDSRGPRDAVRRSEAGEKSVVGWGGEVVGNIGFHGPPDEAGTVEIGYDIVESLWGQGIASGACAAIVAIARDAGAALVRAETEPGNLGSQRVLINNGFLIEPATDGDAELKFRLAW